MQEIFNQLNTIEKEHPEFFKETGKSITVYITKGMFGKGIFINSDLPKEIIDKIRKAFDEYSLTIKDV